MSIVAILLAGFSLITIFFLGELIFNRIFRDSLRYWLFAYLLTLTDRILPSACTNLHTWLATFNQLTDQQLDDDLEAITTQNK